MESLTELREQIELPASMKATRQALFPSEEWKGKATTPLLDEEEAYTGRMIAWAVSGFGLVSLGAPAYIAALAGGLFSLMSAWAVDWLSEAETVKELEQKCVEHFSQRLTALQNHLNQFLSETETELVNRVRSRMGPFLRDVRRRLEELRPPTAEELELYRELESQIRQALALFAQTFQSEQDKGPAADS